MPSPRNPQDCARVLEYGIVVAELGWDGGGPGAATGVETIYRYRGKYWPCASDYGFAYGVFDSLQQALQSSSFYIAPATRWVVCEQLSAARLAALIPLAGAATGHVVKLNSEPWMVVNGGTLRPCRNRSRRDDGEPAEPFEYWRKGLFYGGPRDGGEFYILGEPFTTVTTHARLENGRIWRPVYRLADASKADLVAISVARLNAAPDRADVLVVGLRHAIPVIYGYWEKDQPPRR